MKEHTNIKLRQLLESWHPTQREAERLFNAIDHDTRRIHANPDIVVGDDGYYVDLFGVYFSDHMKLVAEAGARLGLTFEKVKAIRGIGRPSTTRVVDLEHDEVITMRFRRLLRGGRLYQFVKRS